MARTEYSYDSYTDFWRLVELSGFEICTVPQIDITRNCIYITTPINGELRPHLEYRRTLAKQRCKIIWWALERHALPKDIYSYVDEVWVSDRYYKSTMLGRFVVLGSDAGLCLNKDPLEKAYDFVHLSYIYGRRENAINRLYRWRIAPNGWGGERDKIIRASKVMLNVHQDEFPIIEPLRFALGAAYGIPILSENMTDSFPYDKNEDYIGTDFWDIHKAADSVMNRDLTAMGNRLREKMTVQYRFGDQVRNAVADYLKQ